MLSCRCATISGGVGGSDLQGLIVEKPNQYCELSHSLVIGAFLRQ